MIRRRFLKPIDQLRPKDLEGRPFWRFAEDAEGLSGQDETSVEPLPYEELTTANSLFVVADFRTADGTTFVGLVEVDPHKWSDPAPCALITTDAYAPLPRKGGRLADDLLRYSESKLGFSLKGKMPIAYTLRAALTRGASPLTGHYLL